MSEDDKLRLKSNFHPWTEVRLEKIVAQAPTYYTLTEAEKLYAAEVEGILRRVATKVRD